MHDGEGDEIGDAGAEEGGEVVVGVLDPVAGEGLEEGCSDVAAEAAKARDGGDDLFGKEVAAEGVEVAAEALMSGGGETDDDDGGPEVGEVGAKMMGSAKMPEMSMAVFRARLTVAPRRIMREESMPPPMLPMSAIM